MSQSCKEPHQFLARIAEINASSPPETYDVLECTDGRVVERFSRIQFVEARNVGRVWSFRDITARKQAEKTLAGQRAELERSNAELQRFAYVASHDLQEPLRMVTAYMQLLAQRFRGQLDAEATEYMGFAVEGARRMKALIDDLLAYARLGSREQKLGVVDCEAVLASMLRTLRVPLTESHATVTHEPLPTVWGDAAQLGQVFQNLLSNALKFRGAEPPRVHLGARPEGQYWVLSVQDNGIGIDPQYGKRIFQVFQRLHTQREYPGTGIGLAICKKIVEQHGGQIWVESEPGNGATFFFTLPTHENCTHEHGNCLVDIIRNKLSFRALPNE